ncbi:hypothetical protein ACHAWC_003621 [Mediolabrus comicus]
MENYSFDDEELLGCNCTASLALAALAVEGLRTLTECNQVTTSCGSSNASTFDTTKKSKKKNSTVKFHRQLITSTHVRPRTEEHEIENLFFTEEELDDLEDDRYNTRIADEIEVLAVGPRWVLPDLLPESNSNLSIEEGYRPTLKPAPVEVGMIKTVSSPRSRSIQDRLSSLSPRKNRIVVDQVQIVLCEKSTG